MSCKGRSKLRRHYFCNHIDWVDKHTLSVDVPINSFEFLQPLRTALGYAKPAFTLSMRILWIFVYIMQFFHKLLENIHPSLSFTPLFAEVYKTAVTHYFSCEKAKKDFSYSPENPNDISEAIQQLCEEQHSYGSGNSIK